MGIAFLVVSLVTLFFLSGTPMGMGSRSPMGGDRLSGSQTLWEHLPTRKSLIIDSEGLVHRTADNTQMTKRDRMRVKMDIQPAEVTRYQYREETVSPAAITSAPKQETTAASDYQLVQGRAIPVEPVSETGVERSMSQSVEEQLMKEPNLSDSARFTLKASYREGLVILQGVVLDENEKGLLEMKTREISGVSVVENRLHTLKDYSG